MKSFFINSRRFIPSKYFSTAPLPNRTPILKSILYNVHKDYNAIFKVYNGIYVPNEYKDDTLITSHLHTRSSCSIFDLTYRPILKLSGNDRIEFLEQFIGSDIKNLWTNECRISLLLNENGGIIDDLLAIVQEDCILLFVHIQCKNRVYHYLNSKLQEHSKLNVTIEEQDSLCSIGVQGSSSFDVVNEIAPTADTEKISFMSSHMIPVNHVGDVLCTRYSFTGEDGFDLLISKNKVESVFRELLKNNKVKPAGLEVQETLRLESGFCYYGKDVDEQKTPVEANLQWTLGKRRLKELNFNGAPIIDKQLKYGTEMKRVGLLLLNDSSIVPKQFDKIYSSSDEVQEVGYITSSVFSPVLQKPIAMGYIQTKESAKTNNVKIKIREKIELAQVARMPFVPLSIKKI